MFLFASFSQTIYCSTLSPPPLVARLVRAAARHGKPPQESLGRRLARYLGVFHTRPLPPCWHSRRACALAGVSLPCRWGGCAWRCPKRRVACARAVGAAPRTLASGGQHYASQSTLLTTQLCLISDASWLWQPCYLNQPHSLHTKTLHSLDAWLWGCHHTPFKVWLLQSFFSFCCILILCLQLLFTSLLSHSTIYHLFWLCIYLGPCKTVTNSFT